jgi:hypothetical protein
LSRKEHVHSAIVA